MRTVRLAGSILALTVLSAPASAAPLRDFPVTALQPDGTSVVLFATGDEFHRRVRDAEGFTVVRDPLTGWMVYADRLGTDLVPTSLAAGVANPRSAGLPPWLDEDLDRVEERARPHRIARQAWRSAPTKGTVTNLMVFVRFSGDDELTERIEDYEREFNSTDPGSTSLRAFYRETSRGSLDVTTAFVPPPDDKGWAVAYTDPYERTYYSAYNPAWNQSGYKNDQEAEQREHALLTAALKAVESQIPEDVDLDADEDGVVDNVIFMIQGVPDTWSNLLWPHQWEMFEDVPIRGANVQGYNVQFTSLMVLSTGTFAHEMAHTLGAPDLYHYNQDDLMPVGPWDLMEATASPPQHMLAYLKWKYLGWVQELPTVAHGAQVRLFPSWDKGTQAVRVEAGGEANQWFTLEYRRAEGPFESSLPGSGLLVYRIDEGYTGWGNRNGPPDEVYVFRPGGGPDIRGSVGRAPLGAYTNRDRMNEGTDPAPLLQDGSPVTLRVFEVAEDSEGVTFKVCLVAPDCGEKVCGDDGCGGTCGLCAGLTHCVDGACLACSCDGKACGDDGCGTSCGTCDDSNACTVDTCDAGTCAHASAGSETACDDGDLCTQGDNCDGEGACIGAAFACEAEQCRSAACDGKGGCLREFLAAGTVCDDADPCTAGDQCDGAGLCAGTPSCEPEPGPGSDLPQNDLPIQDVAVPDLPASDVAPAEIASPDLPVSDIAAAEVSSPDLPASDVAAAEVSSPDLPAVDVTNSDRATADARVLTDGAPRSYARWGSEGGCAAGAGSASPAGTLLVLVLGAAFLAGRRRAGRSTHRG